MGVLQNVIREIGDIVNPGFTRKRWLNVVF